MLVHDDTEPGHDELLSLLRTKGLSIKNLDERKKRELREFLDNLCNKQGRSLNDVAKMIGNKTSGYTSWLCRQLGVTVRPFEEARLRGIKEKRRKYERRPFDGTDEDRAYLLGLRHGDLSVSKPWNGAIRVSTSTTHPAMAELFRSLFERYGHVYQHPRYKSDTNSYEWNLFTILDPTFEFLSAKFEESKQWLDSSKSVLLSYLSGLLDAEGSLITTRDRRGKVALFVDYYNSNKALLEWVMNHLEALGYHCSLRINKRKGTRTRKYGIIHRIDYWQLSAIGVKNIQELIRILQPRHGEKKRRKAIALSVRPGDLYSNVEETNLRVRSQIKAEVSDFVRRAEAEYLEKHAANQSRKPAG